MVVRANFAPHRENLYSFPNYCGDITQLVYITIVVVYGNNYNDGLIFKATQMRIHVGNDSRGRKIRFHESKGGGGNTSYVCTYKHTLQPTHTQTNTHTCMHAHAHTHTHIHTPTHAHTRTHTHTHTHYSGFWYVLQYKLFLKIYRGKSLSRKVSTILLPSLN